MSDRWAYCATCVRWFYGDAVAGDATLPLCPVCSTEAATVEERSTDQEHSANPA
ncbi:MAG: hypothetical protein H0T98_05705 [Euzebyaceae bacterium]|jgi:hypothetical protein|nr:hypothetical protein [Euzebyaceae bacterium]